MDLLKRVLVIDDNEDDYLVLKRIIGPSFETFYEDGSGNIIATISELNPDCILLDFNLTFCKGIDILKKIKADKNLSNSAVIMMTNENNPNTVVECMRNDASSYLIKDKLDKEILHLEIERAISQSILKAENILYHKTILELSQKDDLTDLLNRRYFNAKLLDEISRCERSNHFFSYSILDLDHFKKINDLFGHIEGDNVLKIVSSTIKDHTRSVDVNCRYGGDEFIIVLNEYNESISMIKLLEHLEKLNNIRIQIEKDIATYLSEIWNQLKVDDTKKTKMFKVTASMGTTYFNNRMNLETLLQTADACLYRAKENGRNALVYTDLEGKITFFDQL